MARVTAYEAASAAVKADPAYVPAATSDAINVATNQLSAVTTATANAYIAAAGITALTANLTVAGADSTTLVLSNTLTGTTLLDKTEVAKITIGVGTGASTATATAFMFKDLRALDAQVASYKASVTSAIARINQELTTGGTAGAGSH